MPPVDVIPPMLMAVNLAERIRGRLDKAGPLQQRGPSLFRVEGGVWGAKMYSRIPARCWFDISGNWVGTIPIVGCCEPWCTRGSADWHMDASGVMCLDHAERWRQYMQSVASEGSFEELLLTATEWLLNSTISLLGRHQLKHQGMTTEWNRSWAYWPHGKESQHIDKAFKPEPTDRQDE